MPIMPERSLIVGQAPFIEDETWAHSELYAAGYKPPRYPMPAIRYEVEHDTFYNDLSIYELDKFHYPNLVRYWYYETKGKLVCTY